MSRPLSDDEKEFIETLSQALPAVIAREKVEYYTGGLVAAQTLAHSDSQGTGPAVSWRVGRKVGYKTVSFLEWMVGRFGVKRMQNINFL